RHWMSVAFLSRTEGIRNVSNAAALLSKKRMLDRVFLLCRALTRSSLPLWIQKPSKITGIRGNRAAALRFTRMVDRLPSMGIRVNGHFCGLPVDPFIPYQQSMK